MEKLETLTFNKKEIDTSMALEFIKKNNESNEWPESEHLFVEKKVNEITIHLSIDDALGTAEKQDNLDSNPDDVGEKLAKLIEENVEMFVQLEHLARGTDPQDVREGHVKLMSQIIRCRDALWNNLYDCKLMVTKSTPLYMLGTVAADIYKHSYSIVFVQNKCMKHVCQFFAQLCRDAGCNIALIYANVEDDYCNEEFGIIAFQGDSGCTGVITERSDLDSAIDAFIRSSVTAPWRLKQIYVQESVFEDFQSALAAKTREHVVSRHMVVGDKAFLIECLAPASVPTFAASVPTHAYRTTKELLSLLDTPYLSVWSADSALSNEIALLATASTVWVNDYGSFYGPPRAALSVYNIYDKGCNRTFATDNLQNLLQPWSKMEFNERLKIIISALRVSETVHAERLLELALRLHSNGLLHITDKTICFGIQQQMTIICIDCIEENEIEHLFRVVKCLLNGNAVMCTSIPDIFHELFKVGVPIGTVECRHGADHNEYVPQIMERLKIVRTNYGTIFAN